MELHQYYETYRSSIAQPSERLPLEDGRTIRAHKEIIDNKRLALLGKRGRALGTSSIKTLNDQIARGVETYLFL
jgi:hypothetical protein